MVSAADRAGKDSRRRRPCQLTYLGEVRPTAAIDWSPAVLGLQVFLSTASCYSASSPTPFIPQCYVIRCMFTLSVPQKCLLNHVVKISKRRGRRRKQLRYDQRQHKVLESEAGNIIFSLRRTLGGMGYGPVPRPTTPAMNNRHVQCINWYVLPCW